MARPQVGTSLLAVTILALLAAVVVNYYSIDLALSSPSRPPTNETMPLKLHGVPASTCTRRVRLALEEKGVPYELVPVDMGAAQHKSEAFLKMQPFGKVPVLEDDGFFVFESRAIAKYIAEKYAAQGTELLPPKDALKERALFEQACSIELSYFDPLVSEIAFERVFKPRKGLGAADEALVAKLAGKLDGVLAGYERILAKQPYLAGEKVSLADLFHLPYGAMVEGLGFQELYAKYPAFSKWFEGLKGRESWRKITA